MIVGAVVLASEKQKSTAKNGALQQLSGKTVIEKVLDTLETAQITPQVAVLGTDLEEVIEAIRPKLGKVKIALNLAPTRGNTPSFQTGLIVISNVEAAFMVLGDQPLDPAVLKALTEALEGNKEALIAQPIKEGKVGYPLLFRQPLFAQILGLLSTQTIQDVVNAHKDHLVKVDASRWTIQYTDENS
ncbi:MAG: NTP transferase domain-containing protein [Candidatus Bathyarchaeota archaeon]|nr:NTP transferase domain-containing protein [Candidatus Bathyarchaeota archaeon]